MLGRAARTKVERILQSIFPSKNKKTAGPEPRTMQTRFVPRHRWTVWFAAYQEATLPIRCGLAQGAGSAVSGLSAVTKSGRTSLARCGRAGSVGSGRPQRIAVGAIGAVLLRLARRSGLAIDCRPQSYRATDVYRRVAHSSPGLQRAQLDTETCGQEIQRSAGQQTIQVGVTPRRICSHEESSFIPLPAERCGFSTPPNTCVREPFHDGDHRMLPATWIRRVTVRGGRTVISASHGQFHQPLPSNPEGACTVITPVIILPAAAAFILVRTSFVSLLHSRTAAAGAPV